MTSVAHPGSPQRASPRRPASARPAREPASALPIARVAVDVPLPHLDRPFDYLVPAGDDLAAQPGVRVRVRFAGRLVDGFLLERATTSEHGDRLALLERVVSAEPVLAPDIARLCRTVADRYAGTLADVLRLAVPPRHGRVEAESADDADAGAGAGSNQTGSERPCRDVDPAGWGRYRAGAAFLDTVRDGRPARAVWQAAPGEDWSARFAEAAAVAFRAGRGAVLVVPDARDLGRLDAALAATLPRGGHVVLSADLGPAERYRRFLAVRRGTVRVVAGTRAAAFAPVRDLGLLAIFDDGDDLYAEPRAPYPHAREVLALRSAQQHAALLIGGFARTAEAQLLLRSGWSQAVIADRAQIRHDAPRIEAAGDDFAVGAGSAAAHARLPPVGFAVARESLAAGAPVLVQVPRGGYLPGLACADCGRPARCRRCSGPLALARGARTPACRWCGSAAPRTACPACASTRIRATAFGAGRTAEEIGRAFPGVRLRTSGGDKVLAHVSAGPALVVATPGAEPVADGGYGAALLLDASVLLGRADLRAAEEALRRWMAAATLVRPASAGGRVVIAGEAMLPTVQALIRWDPAGHAEAELDSRERLGFPPSVAMAALDGDEDVVTRAVQGLRLPPTGEILGPVPVEGQRPVRDDVSAPRQARALVRAVASERRDLAAALRVLAATRSARKEPGSLRIRVDPAQLG